MIALWCRSQPGEGPDNSRENTGALCRRNWANRSAPPPSSTDMHDKLKTFSRRKIPAVNRVLDALGHYDLPRPLLVDLVRRELSQLRAKADTPDFKSIVDLVRGAIE